jgi:hypothetical protein
MNATLFGDAPPVVVAEARQDGHRLPEPVPEVIGTMAALVVYVQGTAVRGARCAGCAKGPRWTPS